MKDKFEGHFIIKRNVIFERARFKMRVQEEGVSVDNFITDRYNLAEFCVFGDLHCFCLFAFFNCISMIDTTESWSLLMSAPG